jgi:DNA-binding NarL/FixJ family response regulator
MAKGEGSAFGLIGRERESASLAKFARAAARGKGVTVLVSGEAGMGKTALVDSVLARSGLAVLRTAANPVGNTPLAPITILLQALRRDGSGSLPKQADQVAKLLRSQGGDDSTTNRATLFGEICDVFVANARMRPLALFLDDLQWADQTTLEFLPQLAEIARDEQIFVVGAYRSEEVVRGHPIRATRESLRRARLLEEIALEAFDHLDGMRLIEQLAGTNPPPELAAAIMERSGGVPLFVEAIVGVLKQRCGNDQNAMRAVSLPLPESVREAILTRVDLLSAAGRRAVETAAVGGSELALELLVTVNDSDDGIEEVLGSGLMIEREEGRAAFRTPLARDAIYTAIPWTRRRSLHRRFAEALAAQEHDASQLAEHWQNAGKSERARHALLEGAARARRLHAYGDAVQLLRRALDLWPPGEDDADRCAALDQLGDCAQFAGQFAEAMRAWRELAESASGLETRIASARALRKIANLHELSCDWARAIEARQDAMAAFAAGGESAEAATEGITTSIRLRMSARYAAGLEVLARAEAEAGGREDLRIRIAALRGNLEARLGRVAEGIAMIRAALDAALARDNAALAGEIYQRLADAEERSGKYKGAVSTNLEGVAFCEERVQPGGIVACLQCMSWILVRAGEWKQAIDASQRILDSIPATSPGRGGALLFIGLVHVMRGELRKGEDVLLEAEAINRRIDHALGEVHSRWGLAMHATMSGNNHAGAQRCRTILARCGTIDKDHAFVPMLRWASTCFGQAGDREGLQACGEALGEYATIFSGSEPLSALAHALGEVAWLDEEHARAAEHFEHAISLIEDWDLPRERVESQLRAAAACAAAGRHEAAVAFAREAGRGADRLGARPYAQAAATQLRKLGEPLGGALGPRGKRRTEHGGLTARQLEILAAISKGQTDKQIARGLRLSPRTVEMHVGRLLAALDCRTRAEAVRKAAEYGVLPCSKA